MWVWPGLRLIGAGQKTKRGLWYTVAAVGPEEVTFECGLRLKREDVVRHTRLSHALTFAGCQGLTLHGRVRLETGGPITRRHLYVGCSRCTRADLLEVV